MTPVPSPSEVSKSAKTRPAIDTAIEIARELVAEASTPRDRFRALWAGARNALDFAPEAIVRERFTALGHEFDRKLGHHAAVDLAHVLNWACRGLDPWGLR